MYNAVIPSLPTNSDTACVIPAAGARPLIAGTDDSVTTAISKFPNSAYYGYDLEKSSGILFQGINSRSAPPFLNSPSYLYELILILIPYPFRFSSINSPIYVIPLFNIFSPLKCFNPFKKKPSNLSSFFLL